MRVAPARDTSLRLGRDPSHPALGRRFRLGEPVRCAREGCHETFFFGVQSHVCPITAFCPEHQPAEVLRGWPSARRGRGPSDGTAREDDDPPPPGPRPYVAILSDDGARRSRPDVSRVRSHPDPRGRAEVRLRRAVGRARPRRVRRAAILRRMSSIPRPRALRGPRRSRPSPTATRVRVVSRATPTPRRLPRRPRRRARPRPARRRPVGRSLLSHRSIPRGCLLPLLRQISSARGRLRRLRTPRRVRRRTPQPAHARHEPARQSKRRERAHGGEGVRVRFIPAKRRRGAAGTSDAATLRSRARRGERAAERTAERTAAFASTSSFARTPSASFVELPPLDARPARDSGTSPPSPARRFAVRGYGRRRSPVLRVRARRFASRDGTRPLRGSDRRALRAAREVVDRRRAANARASLRGSGDGGREARRTVVFLVVGDVGARRGRARLGERRGGPPRGDEGPRRHPPAPSHDGEPGGSASARSSARGASQRRASRGGARRGRGRSRVPGARGPSPRSRPRRRRAPSLSLRGAFSSRGDGRLARVSSRSNANRRRD